MMNGSHVSTENDNDPVVRTRDDNERKSFAHPWFNGITIGEIEETSTSSQSPKIGQTNSYRRLLIYKICRSRVCVHVVRFRQI